MIMVSFYYAHEFLPFIIDTVIYATIIIIALNIVLKDSKKLNTEENKKRKFYFRLIFVLIGAPLLTGFLYSSFHFNLGKLFTKPGLWVLGSLFALVILIPILLAVFKKLPSVKGFGWLWWFVPIMLIPFAIVAFKEHPKIRDYIIYFSIFFLFFVALFLLARDKEPDKTVKNKPKKPRQKEKIKPDLEEIEEPEEITETKKPKPKKKPEPLKKPEETKPPKEIEKPEPKKKVVEKETKKAEEYIDIWLRKLEKTMAWVDKKVDESEVIMNKPVSKDYTRTKQNEELNIVLEQIRQGPKDGLKNDEVKGTILLVNQEIKKLPPERQKLFNKRLGIIKKFWGIKI